MRLTARVVTVLTASLLAVGTLTVPAHAASPVLVSSSPAAGSTTKTKPSSVSLTFDQAVATSSTITVTAPPGTSPCTKSTQTAPSTTISCTFTGLPQATVNDGTYTVSYVAKSTGTGPDGTGSFQFVLDTVAPSAPTGLAISPSPYLAASETLTVTGASEQASDSVRVSLSGGSSVSRTVSPAADKSFSAVFTAAEVAGLSDGTVTASATSTDVAGNTGPAATRTVVKDSARPTIVSTDPADGGSKKPASFAYTVNASETLASSSRVDLFDATQTQIAVATSVTSSTVKATPGALPDGAYTAKIHLVDVNGNTGNPGGAPSVRTFTIDNTAPASPSITTPLAPINRSNQAAYPVAGTGEARAVVTVRVGSATKTVTVAGDGTWSTPVDTSALSDGSVSVTATQTDAAGNVSPVSSTASTFKDTVAPAITGQAVTPARMGSATLVATVTGSVNDGGGPLPPAGSESDVPVTLTADDTDPTTAPVVVEGRTNSSGGFSLQVDTSTLSDGTISYRAVATDAAGNPSPAVSVSNTKNTVPPGMPTVAISPKPINNANKAAITVSGSTTGTSVSITLTDGTTTIGPFTPTVSGGTYSQSVNTTALADGIVTASVVPRDAAGNTGPTGTAEAVKDTGVPSAPTSVAVPQYLTSGTLPVSGRAEPGSTVTVVVSDSASTPATATRSVAVLTDGAWELSVNVSALADGVLTLSVKAADAAGNVSPATSPAPETFKDTVAPDRPASLSATPSPYIPSSTTFTVAGTTSDADRSAALTVDITVADTDPATADLTVKNVAVTPGALPLSPGSFSHAFSSTQIRTLRDGALTVTAVLHDRAGNASAARTATAVKDTTLLALVATAPDTAPSGAGGTVEGLTNNASRTSATFNEAITPTTHPAETRSTITVKNRNNVTVAGVGSVSGETITFTPSSPLSDAGSPYSVTVHAVDAALTTESIDIAYTFRVDTVAPAAPVITSVTNPVNASNQSAVQVRGTAAEVGRSVRVTIGSLVATPTVAGDGTWSTSMDLTSLPDGTTSVSASQADAAGNASSAGTAELVKDTVAPVFVAASPRDGSVVQPPSSIEVTFSERLGSGSVTVAGVPGTSARSGDAIVFTPTGPIPDGTYTVQTSVTDVAGNSGGHDTTFTVDGTGPAIADLAATATTAAQQSSTVSGSTEAGASVAITATDGTDEVTTSVTAGDDGEFSKALDLTGLADGTVTVTARATDTVGNPGPQASTTAPRDATAPTVAELTATASTLATPTSTVTGVRSESSSVAVSATDGEATVRAAVPAGTGEFSVDLDLSSLETGTITVEAVATDGSGNTGPAATTTTTRDATVPGSTTTLDPTPRRILHGESLVLSGTVTRVEDSEPYGDVHLTAYDERGRVIDLGDVQPDDSGAFSLRITPDHNATYAASYAGDALAAESTSRPQATKVSVRITAKSVQKKRKVRVKGSVSPDKAGEKVRLHLKRGRYRTIATTKVRANGSYAFRVELPRGKSRLRVVMAATDGNAGGATRLVVRRR